MHLVVKRVNNINPCFETWQSIADSSSVDHLEFLLVCDGIWIDFCTEKEEAFSNCELVTEVHAHPVSKIS